MGLCMVLMLLCFTSQLKAEHEKYVAYVKHQLVKDLSVNYSKNAAPQKNISDVVEMNVTFHLRNILSLEETSEILTSSGWLSITWYDFRLSWVEGLYGGIDTLHVRRSEVWIPDLTVDNTANQYKILGQSDDSVRISSDGLVEWNPGDVFKTRCSMDVTYFPFDEQTCNVVILSWMFDNETLQIGFLDVPVPVTEQHGEWNVTGINVSRDVYDDSETSAIVSIQIRRRNTFHILNLVLPIITVTFVNAFVFILPAESGEKINLATALFLSYAVFLSYITDNMPNTSTSISILGVFVAAQLMLSALSILCTVVILKQYHKRKDKGMQNREAQTNAQLLYHKLHLFFFVLFFVLGVGATGTLIIMLELKFL